MTHRLLPQWEGRGLWPVCHSPRQALTVREVSVALSWVLSRQRVLVSCDPNGKGSLSAASPPYTVVDVP